MSSSNFEQNILADFVVFVTQISQILRRKKGRKKSSNLNKSALSAQSAGK